MLFDKILGNSDIINDNWKKEINKLEIIRDTSHFLK